MSRPSKSTWRPRVAGGAEPAWPRLVAPYTGAELQALVARHGSPLLVVDCDVVRAQYRRLAAALPGVDLHYALKPLPEAAVVATLMEEGASFDLATSGEVELVRALGVEPKRCIHTHPIKRDQDIRDALRYGVRLFVVDNPDELGKFVRYRKRVEVMLRVSFRAPDAVCDLSKKFGCAPEDVPELLRLANRLGVKVVGLSFHVGSQAGTPEMHVRAAEACVDLIRLAREHGLAELAVLDIGGGFPVGYREPVMPIEEFCAPIVRVLERVPAGVRLIAEPGRFISGPAGTCVATVMGRAKRDGRWWYYLDDGLYGSYSGQLYDHARYPVDSLKQDGPRFPSVLAGPTCDSIDVIAEDLPLPELEAGDLVVGRVMGAYTWASATDFNFFPRAKVVPVNVSRPDAAVVDLARPVPADVPGAHSGDSAGPGAGRRP
ncbi:MAG: type III PLP-dependent enzyme [Steroidobacteraceae bacterium]|nr:type III PLP-dependent enzyme [Steroidobacteraceae bacterium]